MTLELIGLCCVAIVAVLAQSPGERLYTPESVIPHPWWIGKEDSLQNENPEGSEAATNDCASPGSQE